jgi:TonB-linked SusC/RagA family outer membrane protein
VLKGSSIGTATDAEGNFVLTLPDATGVLSFSFIGFATQEISVENQSVINITLLQDVTSLTEVVVTALGITREEKSLGYATQQVEGENLTYTKEQNVLGALAGKIAGVQVVGSSGASMGGTQKIKIRGVNSINGTDQPLIVVDGTPISNANFAENFGADYGNLAQDVNAEDIESVNVLKGPAASALYGIRGQYGVIMITTKKGTKGSNKVKIELNSAFSVERVGNIMPYQNVYGGGYSQTFDTLPNGDPYVNLGADESWGPKMDGTPVRQFYSFYPQDPDYEKLTPFLPQPDNIRDYFELGSNLNNGITVSGGGASTNYRISFNDTRIEGTDPNTWLRRNNFGLSLGADLSKKLNFTTNINYARNRGQRPSQGSEVGSRYVGQWFQRNVDMNRLKDYKYEDGSILHWNLDTEDIEDPGAFEPVPAYWNNPFFNAYENTNNDSRDRIFGDIGLTYEVISQLTLSGHIRSDMYTQNIEERTAFGGTGTPSYSVGKYQGKEMNYEFLANYEREWGDFSLNTNLGANLYDFNYTSLYQATAGGLSTPNFYNIEASIDRPTTTSTLRRKQIRSAYALVSMGFRDTYFIDASIRNDVSSALPDKNNSYWYPSVSGSFVFSELVNWGPLSLGKLRASYAQAGSDLDPYLISPSYEIEDSYGGTVNLAVPNVLVNPDIKPSFAHSYEAGIDLRFFNGRLGFDLTYYEQKNKDQIIPLTVSGTSGYSSVYINAGLIENKGIEITLSAVPLKAKDFSWNTSFNYNRNRNMVVELHPELDVYPHYSNRYAQVNAFLNSYEGKSFGRFIGTAYQRDEASGKILLGTNNLPLYTDATHDFGTVLPDFTGGFQNVFHYKNFNLSAMIDFQSGGQFFSRSKSLALRTGLDPATVAINDKGVQVREPVAEGGGIRVDGISQATGEDVTAYIDPAVYYGTVARRIYETNLYDASYIKLREVRLGYTFTRSTLGTLPFESISLAFILRNPAMLWQKAPEGLDPSELSSGSQAISWYETGQLNTVRSYGLNLNITF